MPIIDTPSQTSDPWLEGANLDLSGFNLAHAASLPDDNGDDPNFGNRLTASGPKTLNIKKLLENPDPELIADLSERDPKFKAYFIEDLTKRVGAEFRAKNPQYQTTDRNTSTLLKFLGKKYLEASQLLDDDLIMDQLAEQGFFTVENLTGAYQALLAAGKLDVPVGLTRALTKKERLDTLSMIRVGDIENAVVQYLIYSFGGRPPKFNSPRDFLSSHPKLASEAALWCWSQTRTDLTPEIFREFRATKLDHLSLLTISLINQAWSEFREELKSVTPAQEPEPELTSREIDALPDADFENLRASSIREYLKTRRG
jgi:hypothetical protein